MNESKFTEQALDYITDYVALARMNHKAAKTIDCLNYIAEKMQFNLSYVAEAFGDIVKDEIDRVNAKDFKLDESIESFSKTLLTEDEVSDVQNKVNIAAKTQKNTTTDSTAMDAQAAKDKQVNDGNSVRKYFVYLNLVDGKLAICSELENANGKFSKQLLKWQNMLKTITKPTWQRGIFIAPISFNDAKQYYAANKGKIAYYDLTPGAEQQTQQTQQTDAKQQAPAQQNDTKQQAPAQQQNTANQQNTEQQQANEKEANLQKGKDLSTKIA